MNVSILCDIQNNAIDVTPGRYGRFQGEIAIPIFQFRDSSQFIHRGGGGGFDPHSGRRVVSLSKIHLHVPPKSTGNTQETMAPFRHDWEIVYWDIKQKINENLCREKCVNNAFEKTRSSG